MLRTRFVALLVFVTGGLASVLVVGMPHFDQGNLFGALVVGVGLSVLAGGVTGAVLGDTSKTLAAWFVGPLVVWDFFALVSSLEVGLQLRQLALWLGETALLALVFFASGKLAARLRDRRRNAPRG